MQKIIQRISSILCWSCLDTNSVSTLIRVLRTYFKDGKEDNQTSKRKQKTWKFVHFQHTAVITY